MIDNGIQRVQGGSKVIPTQFRIQWYKPLVANNGTSSGDEVIKDTPKGVLDTYTLAQDSNTFVC
jgi:hypothetical protein